MEETNGRNVFVLGANIREDLEQITKTERMLRNRGGWGDHPDPPITSFEELQNRHQDFQKFYNCPAGEEIKIRV